MNKSNKEANYSNAFIEYQSNQYLPGYYTGGKIPPALRAKTKVGGYVMVIGGILYFFYSLFLTLKDFSIGSIAGIIPIGFAVLLIFVGQKFIRSHAKKHAPSK